MKAMLLVICFLVKAAYAQVGNRQMEMQSGSLFITDVTGIPYSNRSEKTFTSGTEFYNDNWQKAVVIAANGSRTKPFLAKLNLFTNQLHYLNDAGREYIAQSAVKEVIVFDSLTGKSTRFLQMPDFHGTEKSFWYQEVEAAGALCLYKLYRKRHVEQKQYSSATTEHSIETTEVFYLMQPGGTQQIKSVKDLITALPDKQAEVEAFLKTQGRVIKLEEKLSKAIQHYNSLAANK